MNRIITHYLHEWKINKHRKPLLLCGARQVGKTFEIRQLAKSFQDFVEINFELMPQFNSIFEQDLDPKRILRELNILTGRRIAPGKTLLFFDEVQVQPKVISALRYFFEMIPSLHVIAAGSLVDFAIENISMPVGRIQIFYLHPLSFIEFLSAMGENLLAQQVLLHQPQEKFSEAFHQKLLNYLSQYMAVGGMPESVRHWVEQQDIFACMNVQHAMITTYQQDFQKYAKKFQLKYVELLLKNIPRQLGGVFRFSQVPGEFRKRELAPCLALLVKANIAQQVFHSSAHGIPLGAEINLEKFKVIFLDVALSQAMLGLDRRQWLLDAKIELVNKGALAEAFIGQELLAYMNPDKIPQLFYWHKESRASQAEVDYVVQVQDKIIPVEVKSGEGRSLKSLRLFLETHPESPYGVRFSIHSYSVFDQVHSYPLYAVAGLFAENKKNLLAFVEAG